MYPDMSTQERFSITWTVPFRRRIACLGILLVTAAVSYTIVDNASINSIIPAYNFSRGRNTSTETYTDHLKSANGKSGDGNIGNNSTSNYVHVPSTCPNAIRKSIGIYPHKTIVNNITRQGFENVLLLVSSNFGYLGTCMQRVCAFCMFIL